MCPGLGWEVRWVRVHGEPGSGGGLYDTRVQREMTNTRAVTKCDRVAEGMGLPSGQIGIPALPLR